MTAALGAFLLGASGQQVTSRNVRLSLGATWRPSSAALGALSAVVAGPAGSMGELTLVNPTTVGVNPFVAVVQGTHSAVQGQYHVPNDTYRTLASTAQHASQHRRNLIAVTVDDSEAAGVASSPTTDRARLHVIEGALNAVGPAPLPTVPPNSLLLGEVVIPPAGQAVTITPYNPRTTGRGGILPVLNDASTLPGHAGALPVHDGEYRDHPTLGLQRGKGGAWVPPQTDLGLGGFIIAGGASAPTQTVTNAAWAAILFAGDGEVYDPLDGHVAGASAWTVPAGYGGLWLAGGQGGFAGSTTGRRGVQVRKNDVEEGWRSSLMPAPTTAAANMMYPVQASLFFLVPGDTLRLYMFQESGVSMNINRLNSGFWGVRLAAV